MLKFVSALFSALLFATSASAVLAAGGQPQGGDCRGTDMMEEFRQSDPDLAAEVEAAGREVPNAEAILWRIEKDARQPSYLFGTVHLADARITNLSKNTEQALRSSSTVALEIADLSPSAMSEAIIGAAKLAIYQDGNSLKSLLSSVEFKKVQDTLQRNGMPPLTANVFRPWVVSMLLASSDCERRKVKNGAKVLDMKISDLAKKNGATVVGLETLESQLRAMASIPEDDQLTILKAGLAFADRSDDLVETLLHFYLNRQLGSSWQFQLALAKKAGFEAETFSAFNTNLIVNRNYEMRKAAIPLLEKGGAFIAVGALHLPGKTGLVELLRKAGYTVTAVE